MYSRVRYDKDRKKKEDFTQASMNPVRISEEA